MTSAPMVWAPLRHIPFARLYLCYTLAFLAVAMVDVTVAWVIADAGAPPSEVALVSTAATLPIFALVIPFGALADIAPRRMILLYAQGWATLMALCLAGITGLFAPSSMALVGLVGLFAMSTAARIPALSALVPTRVDPEEMGAAMTLLGMAASVTRLVGPLMATVIIGWFADWAVFVVAAAFSVLAYAAIRLGGQPRPAMSETGERFGPALRTALGFMRQSPEFQKVLRLGLVFFFLGAPGFALAPLLASGRFGGEALVFMSVTSAAGVGALLGGLASPVLAHLPDRVGPLSAACLALALGSAIIALAPVLGVALAGSVIHGMGWIWGLSRITAAAQGLLPDWIRARGMAATFMSTVGGLALGAAFWGVVADHTDIPSTLWASAVMLAILAILPRNFRIPRLPPEEIAPRRYWSEFTVPLESSDAQGPVLMRITYDVRPECVEDFLALMQETRRRRLRTGALQWVLLRDLEVVTRFTEEIAFSDPTAHALHIGRTTEADYLARSEKLAMLSDPKPAIRYVMQQNL